MSRDVRLLPFAVLRQLIAELILGSRPAADMSVGDVVLWPHQRDAVARLRMAISEFGGAMLADDVGTGKTYVALAIASRYAAPLIVAPAALRDGWQRAAHQARRALPFLSFESLSRGRREHSGHDFVIVDEAHHCRNSRTRRYDALAALIVDTPVVLLSATPIHNRRDDLIALLALFLGASAGALDAASIARCVVRRSRQVLGGASRLPRINGPIALATDFTDDVTPDAILALPPPVPAADAGVAGALLAYTLLRQWASSQGALLAGIRRRLAFAHALGTTLDEGRYPTRSELAAWTLGDDAQQLTLGALLSPANVAPARAELRDAIAAHADGLRALRRVAAADPDIDRRRAKRLHDVWRAHEPERSIAFSQFAETIDAYWAALRNVPGTCALTARGARTAGGPISRSLALGSFRPGNGPRPGAIDRISALLTTDLASEGIDLQDASVLVHLDLPWTPARLEQRVGRIVRPGSPHSVAHLYAMEPPIGAARLLDIRRRLATKLAAARESLGAVMPDLGFDLTIRVGGEVGTTPSILSVAAPATAVERLESILRRWRVSAEEVPNGSPSSAESAGLAAGGTCSAVAARAAGGGWVALISGEPPRIVACLDGRVSDDPALVADACQRIDGANRHEADPSVRDLALAAARLHLDRWLDEVRGAALSGAGNIDAIRARRRALKSIAELSEAPASVRLGLSAPARRALAAAGQPLGAGSERRLVGLGFESGAPRAEWLDAVGRLSQPVPSAGAAGTGIATILALIVLCPER